MRTGAHQRLPRAPESAERTPPSSPSQIPTRWASTRAARHDIAAIPIAGVTQRRASINDDNPQERGACATGGPALRSPGSPIQLAALPPPARLPASRFPAVVQRYRTNVASEEAVGTGQQLYSQSPKPELHPADSAVLPPTPTKIAYAEQQTRSGSAYFNVADDVSMAVHATTDEPKEFFAKNAVFNASNKALAETGTTLRLKKAGGQIQFGAITLPKIMPDRTDNQDNSQFIDLWAHICIDIANYIMGNSGSRTGDIVLQSGTHKASATITSDDMISHGINRLAGHLSDTAPQPEDTQTALNTALSKITPAKLEPPPGKSYGRASAKGGLSDKARKLGVNEFARPEVGEGFATYTVFSQDKKATDYTTRRSGRPGKEGWGYHHAAVVARSLDGKDWMTLENYNRTPQIREKANQYLVQKYTGVARRKQKELRLAGKTAAEIKQETYIYLTQKHAAASLDYQKLLQNSAIPGDAMWFFHMYGSKLGQTFHEQQAASGAYVNPLTVRTRKNVVGLHRNKLDANEQRILTSIAAARINWSPARAALDTLDAATTQAFTAMRAILDGLKDQRTDAQLTLGLQQVGALYAAWLTNSFVPRMADALHAIKRGTLGARPTTLVGLKAQADSPETQSTVYGIASGVGDWLNDKNYFSSNASSDRTTSLTNLRAAIQNVPGKAV